jgi:glycosyltransferase involved in cell wall biosynthesis
MNTDLSILIPARNAEATIARAIDSALSQHGVNVEVIVLENGSTDATEDAAKSIADDRVTVVSWDERSSHGNLQGAGQALNRAAALAEGRYFMELDADDWLERDSLAPLVNALDTAPAYVGFAYGATHFHGSIEQLYVPPAFVRTDFYQANTSLYPFVYRRAAWEAGCRYADLIPGLGTSMQDWDFVLQLIEHMRYDGLAFRHTVLHYQYNRGSAGQVALRANSERFAAILRQRYPNAVMTGV